MFIEWAGPFYKFDGWFFEVHRYVGPWPLNQNGEPRKTPPGQGFWHMWDRFSALSKDEQEKHKVWPPPSAEGEEG